MSVLTAAVRELIDRLPDAVRSMGQGVRTEQTAVVQPAGEGARYAERSYQ